MRCSNFCYPQRDTAGCLGRHHRNHRHRAPTGRRPRSSPAGSDPLRRPLHRDCCPARSVTDDRASTRPGDPRHGTPQKPGDLVYLGTTNARYTYGFDLSADWKGFDFTIFFQGAMQRKFLIAEETLSPILGTADMPWSIHMDHWTPSTPNGFFPRMYQTSAHNFRPSDKWAQNGSYIRLKNVQIGYKLPIGHKTFREIKVYVSGQDLWESTKVLKVFDPEVGNNVSATAYPFYRTVAFGINVSL